MTPESTTTRLASRLRSLREERGWSQTELADRADSTQQHVSLLESGAHAPSLGMLLRLARALDVTLDELAGGDHE